MKTNYLFPYRFKKLSGLVFWLALLILVVLYTCNTSLEFKINSKVFSIVNNPSIVEDIQWFNWIENDIIDECLFFILIIAGLVHAFSKEKIEDEMVSKIRLDSLVWATYFNYILSLLCYLFVYGLPFLNIMCVALFSHLLFFIIRFRWVIYKQNNILEHEK
nr:hypothetical protein [uncultured Flavobacterium sp.]